MGEGVVMVVHAVVMRPLTLGRGAKRVFCAKSEMGEQISKAPVSSRYKNKKKGIKVCFGSAMYRVPSASSARGLFVSPPSAQASLPSTRSWAPPPDRDQVRPTDGKRDGGREEESVRLLTDIHLRHENGIRAHEGE